MIMCQSTQVCRFSRLSGGVGHVLVAVLTLCVDGVTAQSDGGISWTAVAISWTISTITTVILIAAAFAIQRCCGSSKHGDSSEETPSQDETTAPIDVNGRKMALGKSVTQRNERVADVEESALVTSSAPINTDQPRHQKLAAPTVSVERETHRHANDEVRERRPTAAGATDVFKQPAVDNTRRAIVSTETRQQVQQVPYERQPPDRHRRPVTAAAEARPSSISDTHRNSSFQQPPSQADRQPASSTTVVDTRLTVNESRNDRIVAGEPASAARQQRPMTFQPLSVGNVQLPQPSIADDERRARSGWATNGQAPTTHQAGELVKQNSVVNNWEEEPAEPMRLAPRSERHRQQQMLKRDSFRRRESLSETGADDAVISTRRQRHLSQDDQVAAVSGRRESPPTSSSDSESPSNTESESETTSDITTPRNVAKLVPPRLTESSVVSALPAPAPSSVFPLFTARPAVQKAGLLRPEPRHVRQTVRRRPSSLDNTGTAFEKAVISSSALLSGDHDSRLTAWQRVQASIRPAHSDPIISSQRTASASSAQVSSPSRRSEAKVVLLPTPNQTKTPAVSRPSSLEVRKAAPTQQRLRQVIRDPSANPSPPIAIVQPSTSNVAVVKAVDNVDRRRRQRHEPPSGDSYRLSSTGASAQSQRTRQMEDSLSRTTRNHRASSTGQTRSQTSASTSGRRTGNGHEPHGSKDFFSPGPMQTSTPGPSTPETKRSKKHEDFKNIMAIEHASAPIALSSIKFHGLLSDEGLRQITRSIGSDWRRLASALRLPSSSMTGSTSSYDVLRDWRDHCSGDVRARLSDALMSTRRSDLARKLIDEETSPNTDKLVTIV